MVNLFKQAWHWKIPHWEGKSAQAKPSPIYIKLNYGLVWWGIGGQVLFMLSDLFFKINMMI